MPELSFGQQLVGLDFNPSGDPRVIKAKQLCADLADMVNDHDQQSQEKTRLGIIIREDAIGEILKAQMLVVKLLTNKY